MDSKNSDKSGDEIDSSKEERAPDHDKEAAAEGENYDPWPTTLSFLLPNIKEKTAKRDRQTLETFTAHVTRASLNIINGNFDGAENNYADALKLIYRRQNNSDRVKQCFLGLAKIYGHRAKKEKNLEEIVNAVGLLNGALRRSTDDEEKVAIIAELEELDNLSLQIIHGSQSPGLGTKHSDDMENKARLESLRCKYKIHMESIAILEDGVQPIERNRTVNMDVEVKFTVAVEELYRLISVDMKEFMKKILCQSIEKFGSPPCAFALVGLGSLARQEMTPFSDFEFIFLIETDTEEIRSYFRKLTYYMHIRVLNLQETLIPSLGLKHLNDTYRESKKDNWFWEEGPRGISFDGAFSFASKTPLGRKPTKQKNWAVEFIKSPKQMAEFQEEDVMLKEGYHVASILRQVVFVAGEASLAKEYKKEMDLILQGKSESQADSTHGTMKMIQKQTQKMLAKDVEKYAPENDTINNEGMLWHVKKEIYRLTSLILDATSCLYDIKTDSSWEIIQQMKLKGLLGDQAAHNLSLALSIGTYLRLKAYMNNKSQAENITVLPRRDDATHLGVKLIGKIFHVKKKGLILRFLQISSPLVQIAKDLCFKEDFLSPLVPLSSALCDTSVYQSAVMRVRLMDLKEAEYLLKICVNEREHNPEADEEVPLFMVYFQMGHVASMLANFEVSDEYHKKALEASRKYSPDNPEYQPVIATLANISRQCRKKAKYEEALQYLKEAQRITETWTEEQVQRFFPAFAIIKENLGLLYCETGNLSEGIKMLEEVLDENRTTEEGPGLPELISNLGAAHLKQGNFEKAETYMMESLNMMTDLYGVSVSHPAISEILNNLGILYILIGEIESAISVLEENADMTEQLFGKDTVHSDRISSLYNLANAYFQISLIPQALASYEELLILRRQLLGEDAKHPAIAGNLNNIGACYTKFQDYDKAIFYYSMAFEMRKQIYGEDVDHHEIADSHFNLGCGYFEKFWLDEALMHYKIALEMFKKVHGEASRHPYICETHENIRRIYEAMGNEKAAKFHGDVLNSILVGT
ncbi:tetratricopeptide repeat 28-like, partial [Paramuricea clavata]